MPDPLVNRTARKLRLRVPSSLRSSAAGYRQRYVSKMRALAQ